MLGEALALLAVFSFATANAAVAKGATLRAAGDNGAFLSVVLTTVLAGSIWFVLLDDRIRVVPPDPLAGLLWFAVSGLLATVVGRATLFRSIVTGGAINAGVFRRIVPLVAAMLAFLILGEAVSIVGAVGMSLIAVSILVAVVDARLRTGTQLASGDPANLIAGQIYGSISAAAYGSAYVARKLGMQGLPDAAFGALISSVTALGAYGVAAILSSAGRRRLRQGLMRPGRYQLTAAIGLSIGQTAQFFAIKYTSVTVVAVIGSLEMFVSAYIAVFLFRTEGWPTRAVILASVMATAGVILVAFG
ncbi:DMT family transporter [Antarcticirhabdus aurantiaca]|uniref:DMT family transporter n=1 Tax=Antarcticirhabdus aurantiaca TaxID=2606717 RepID=UPI00131CD5B8|nr:DMT family transporter [Antarcticirhabdus aurantiaca]